MTSSGDATGERPVAPEVDVVILTWNDGPLLESAVQSAFASTDVDPHIIVVDNGSSPPASLAERDRIRLIRNESNRGVAAGRNQGIMAGTSEFVCLLDSDARLLPDTLERLIAPLEKDPKIGLSAPVFVGQAPEASAGKAPTLMRKLNRAFRKSEGYRRTPEAGARGQWTVDFAIGACQLIRRAAWVSVRGLDEAYFYGPEDVDFCLRLRNAGWRVVQVAEAQCEHPPRRSHRGVLTKRGMAHARALLRHLMRHQVGGRGVVFPRQSPLDTAK